MQWLSKISINIDNPTRDCHFNADERLLWLWIPPQESDTNLHPIPVDCAYISGIRFLSCSLIFSPNFFGTGNCAKYGSGCTMTDVFLKSVNKSK